MSEEATKKKNTAIIKLIVGILLLAWCIYRFDIQQDVVRIMFVSGGLSMDSSMLQFVFFGSIISIVLIIIALANFHHYLASIETAEDDYDDDEDYDVWQSRIIEGRKKISLFGVCLGLGIIGLAFFIYHKHGLNWLISLGSCAILGIVVVIMSIHLLLRLQNQDGDE